MVGKQPLLDWRQSNLKLKPIWLALLLFTHREPNYQDLEIITLFRIYNLLFWYQMNP